MCDGKGLEALGGGAKDSPCQQGIQVVREPGSEVHLGVTRNYNLAQGVLRLAGGKAEARLSGVLAVLGPSIGDCKVMGDR